MPSSVSSASSTASSQERQNNALVSLNVLLRSTPLPTVSSLHEITPSLLVDLYEVLFFVKLPYSTPRDPSPESQLRNIRILIGTIAYNVLQMDLSFIDPRKICEGDEKALLEFLKIFVSVANLRRIHPAGSRNLNGSLRQISGVGGHRSGGGTTQLTIAVKGSEPRDVEVNQRESGPADTSAAASTTTESDVQDHRDCDDATESEDTSSIDRSAISGQNNADDDDDDDDDGMEKTVIAVPGHNPVTDDHDVTMTTALSDVTSVAADVIERLNERVALQTSRIQSFSNRSGSDESSERPPSAPQEKAGVLTQDRVNGHAKPPNRSPEPSSVPLPASFAISDEDSLHLVESEDEHEIVKDIINENVEKVVEERASSSGSGRSGSEKSHSRRGMTASPSKVDPRYLSPEKTPIIGFDTSPSATMAYKAELRASFSGSLRHEGTFVWDPTPPEVQTRPLMEFNSFYSTAETTAEQTKHITDKEEAVVSLDFAAVVDALDNSRTEEEGVEVYQQDEEAVEEGESSEEELPDGEVFEEDQEPVKFEPVKSMIPRPSNQKKGSDKKELLKFFSGQRPIVYRKSFQKPSGASPATRAPGSKLPTRVFGPSPSPRADSPTKEVGNDERDNPKEAARYEADAANYEAEALKDAMESELPEKDKVMEEVASQEDVAAPATPLISTEESGLVQDGAGDSGSEPSPSPMPRSRPLTATALPSLMTVFSPEISAVIPSPTKELTYGLGGGEEEEEEEENMPPSPSSVATSDVSVSTVAWEDSPATAALKRKRFEAMEARRQARGNTKIGSKVAKLALNYGSWTPRSGKPPDTNDPDEDMGDVHSEDGHDEEEDEDDDGDECIQELEEELRQLSEISMKESMKQTNLFRILMKSRH